MLKKIRLRTWGKFHSNLWWIQVSSPTNCLLNVRLHKRIRTCLCSGDVDFGCRSGRETQKKRWPNETWKWMDKHFGCWLVEVGWRDFPGTFLLWEDGKSWAELEILRNGPNNYREFKPSSSTFLGKVCRGCLKMLVFWALCTSHEESEFMSTTVSVAWAELWCKWWRNRRNSRHRYFLNISVR